MKQWLKGSRQMFTRSPWLVNVGKLQVQFGLSQNNVFQLACHGILNSGAFLLTQKYTELSNVGENSCSPILLAHWPVLLFLLDCLWNSVILLINAYRSTKRLWNISGCQEACTYGNPWKDPVNVRLQFYSSKYLSVICDCKSCFIKETHVVLICYKHILGKFRFFMPWL